MLNMMMGSNKLGSKKSSSSSSSTTAFAGKPKTPRLGISGIDYVSGLANHGYNHFNNLSPNTNSNTKHNGGVGGKAATTPSEVELLLPHQHHHQQLQLQSGGIDAVVLPPPNHHHRKNFDLINKTNSVDRGGIGGGGGGGCKLKRKKLQPFEPTYYFDSDFDSEDGSGGGGGRRRGSTLNCSPSIVSRFLRLSRRKSSSKKEHHQDNIHQERDLLNRPRSYYYRAITDQPQQKPGDAQQPLHQSKRLSEDNNQPGLGGGLRGALIPSNNNNNRIYPQDDLTSALQQQVQYATLSSSNQLVPSHSSESHHHGGGVGGTIPPPPQPPSSLSTTDSTPSGGGTGLLSPLRERLAAIEELTTSLQSWQTTEKTEYEKCVSDLASQVSRAVALQQLMKGEVEKLQQRVVDLENHNKAMATMIIPTLMKLHDTTMGSIKDGPQLKSIEPAPPPPSHPSADEDQLMSGSVRTMTTGSDCDSLQRMSSTPSRSSLSRSFIIHSSGGEGGSPSRTMGRNQIYNEEEEEMDSGPRTFTISTGGSMKREGVPSIMSSSTPVTATGSSPARCSPVKAPRTSKMTPSGIPKMNGSSNGNISGSCLSSTSSLSRSSSCKQQPPHHHPPPPLMSMEDNNPSSLSSQDNNNPTSGTSLELSNVPCSSSSSSPARTGIPRVSASPARTASSSRIPQQGGGGSSTPKPARRTVTTTTTTAVATASSDSRSCSPQRGSRLPVRKANLVPTTSRGSHHPAATSRSLPSHGNTPFQKSGPEAGNAKHSKSTFGFGGSPRKSSALPGRPVPGSKPASSSNLPDSSVPTAKPTGKLLANTPSVTGAIPKMSSSGGNPKDEGYSTMSSEALAEQEHHLLHLHSERSSSQRVPSIVGGNPPPSPSVFSRPKVASLPKTNKITGIGSPTSTIVASAVSALESGGKRNSIHKSNTFNTFREMDRETRLRNQSQRSYRVCDDEDDGDDDDLPPSRNGGTGTGSSNPTSNTAPRQFTSLPNSSSSASSSPSKPGSAKASASASPTKRTSKKSDRVTTTRMLDGNIVRIVRGSPYSIRFGEESGDDMEDEEDPSASSTILWEDSDDSDILFLPLEVSGSHSHSPTSSRSTLVPPPQSSGESRSYYSSWGRGTTTTATCSTLERGGGEGEGSNTSINNDDSIASGVSGGEGGASTYSRRAYPLKRTKGEVTVDILLGHQGHETKGGGADLPLNPTKPSRLTNNKTMSNKKLSYSFGGGGGVVNQTDPVVNNSNHDHDLHLLNNHHPNNQADLEEKALIEKWMQLEEVRNEQVDGEDGGEQWAWDWDGVERTYTRVLRNGRIRMREIPVDLDEDDDDIIDVDLILEETGIVGTEEDVEDVEETERVNALNETNCIMQIDSSTWTKSKSNKGGMTSSKMEGGGASGAASPKKSATNSQEASPEKMRREEGDSSAILLLRRLEGEAEDRPLIKSAENGHQQSHSSDENGITPSTITTTMEGGRSSKIGKKAAHSNSKAIIINLDENNGMVVTSSGSGDPNLLEESGGAEADGEEDDPPPVIEFTPEFYRLANYGSNLSFSDNETTPNSVTNSPKLMAKVSGGGGAGGGGVSININNNKSGPSSPARSPKKRRHHHHHLQRRSHSNTNSNPEPQPPSTTTATTPPDLGKMDDKISQTDFSCSSLENMSSVSSELSAECRNCLDIIKKLVVAHGDTDEGEEDQQCSSSSMEGKNNEGAFILENGAGSGCKKKSTTTGIIGVKGETGKVMVDQGSYATTWISVPKGLPTAEVDRILEILSSSESEGVLSPK